MVIVHFAEWTDNAVINRNYRETQMGFVKCLPLITIALLLVASPARAGDKEKMEDYNRTQNTLSNVQKSIHDTNNANIQKIRAVKPKGSTGPTAPPKPTQGNKNK